jgi:tRNA A37 threonylcarbamoyladenosine dehydratase
MSDATPAVYRAIAAVAGAMAKEGIAKDKRNSQQGYNALAPVLSEFGLVILPRVLQRIETERESKSGGALFNVVVEVEFDFVAAEDGSSHVFKTFAQAMDSADKATNKAMLAAYEYALAYILRRGLAHHCKEQP